jgi:hypothetical protein
MPDPLSRVAKSMAGRDANAEAYDAGYHVVVVL